MLKKLTSKKTMLLTVLALALVLCFSFGVSATEYPASYLQGTGTSDAINVTVTVEGLSVPYTEIPVSLSAKTSGTQKVVDALLAADAASSSIGFYSSSTTDGVTTYSPITSSTTYFSHVGYTNNGTTVYDGGSGEGYSGWVFRINGGFPTESAGWGASIGTAVINNGDRISFYVDDPISEVNSALFNRVSATYSNGTVNVAVTESHQYFESDWTWVITDFAASPSMEVEIYNSANVQIGDTDYTGDDGTVAINTGSLPAGTYTVKVLGYKESSRIYYTTSICTFTVQ